MTSDRIFDLAMCGLMACVAVGVVGMPIYLALTDNVIFWLAELPGGCLAIAAVAWIWGVLCDD